TDRVFVDGVVGGQLIDIEVRIRGRSRKQKSAGCMKSIDDRCNSGNRLGLCKCARSSLNEVDEIPQPVSFVASEEKHLVFHDGTAHRTSVLIHSQRQFRLAARPDTVEEVARIQLVVAEKLE